MRTRWKAAVLLTATVATLGAGTGVASAEDLVPVSLDATVELESTAPKAGDLVRGVRSVAGVAEAAEGVRQVELYVVRHKITGIGNAVPIATIEHTVPLARTHFDFAWDSARTPAGLVDVVVIARTATRTAEARVLGIRVEHVVARAASVPSRARTQPARTAAVSGRPARAVRVAGAARPARRHAGVASVASAREVAAKQELARSFYRTYGGLSYEATELTAASARPRISPVATDSAPGVWPFIAGALVLLVSAGHVQRMVRIPGIRTH